MDSPTGCLFLSLPPCSFFHVMFFFFNTLVLQRIALIKHCLTPGIHCGNGNLEQFVVCHKSSNPVGGAAGEVLWGRRWLLRKPGQNPSGTGEQQAQSSAGSWVPAGLGLSPVWLRVQSWQHLMVEDGMEPVSMFGQLCFALCRKQWWTWVLPSRTSDSHACLINQIK